MAGVVVTGGTAVGVEIPCKRARPANGKMKSKPSGNAGINRHRGETNKDRLAAARAATAANQRTLHLVDGRKRTWIITPR